MNIQQINIIDRDNIVIVTSDGVSIPFNRNDLSGPMRTWYDNLLACAITMINETPVK